MKILRSVFDFAQVACCGAAARSSWKNSSSCATTGRGSLPGPLVQQREPGAVLFAGGDGLLDEVHAFDAVVDVGIDRVDLLEGFAFGALDHGVVGAAVDVAEGFEVALGVAARDARDGGGGSAEIGSAGAGVDLCWLAIRADEHLV